MLRPEGQEGVDHVTMYLKILRKEEQTLKLEVCLLLGRERRPIWLLTNTGSSSLKSERRGERWEVGKVHRCQATLSQGQRREFAFI